MDSGLLKTLPVGDIAGDFFVPSYQRGYRWGEQEVRRLLNDIWESNGATYYLQPLVVKERNDGSWELVDGQQRLTTLYLIFRYLKSAHLPSLAINYSLTYETRDASRDYLQTLDEAAAHSNIDYFHMFNAYTCVENWFAGFDHRATHVATRMYDYLFANVKVLWYEAPQEVDSTYLFTRLNVGRIPLTDAELVKAQLLSHCQDAPGETDRSNEIAAWWDLMERDLRVPELWAFITGQPDSEATHIGLLLDTLAGGPRGRERPLFYTFETLRPTIDAGDFWRRVVDMHSLVLGWYDDRDLYHKVGYLIAVGRTFESLVELSMGKGRSAFEASLDDEIRVHVGLTSAELRDLTYTSPKTSDVLLLVNVETTRLMRDSSERYSFKAHATGAWSLEHIHAQNAEPLNTVEQWRAWLQSHKEALAHLPGLMPDRKIQLAERVDEALGGKLTRQVFAPLEKELVEVFSSEAPSDEYQTHSIGNLALLGQADNAALNNSVFEVKRREIIRLDTAGSYIPVCTRRVFLKFYTTAGGEQLHFWGAADRKAYLKAIEDAVRPYLREEEAC